MKPRFVVHWKDSNGKERAKEYPSDAEAKKAERWLRSRGAQDIEIVARLVTHKQAPDPEESWYDNM